MLNRRYKGTLASRRDLKPSRPVPISRRDLLASATATAVLAFGPAGRLAADSMAPTRADHTIHIVPTSLEIAPGRVIKTTAYNGSVPGPLLTLKEGKAFTIDVVNASRYPNLIHWHGLFISSPQDGSIEEGAAIIPDGGSLRYTYIPRPSGTRWYHSHAIAMSDLRRSTYSAA